MKGKAPNTRQEWVDPDDAPELTDEFFEHGTWQVGDRVVSQKEGEAAMRRGLRRGRPPGATNKVQVAIRYDLDLIEAFKSTGKGWQTRINDALREWLKEHKPA